jgi:OOP family OmpA-OmpF porin
VQDRTKPLRPVHDLGGAALRALAALAAAGLAAAGLAAPATAAALDLPAGAQLTAERAEVLGSYAVPTAAWSATGLPATTVEGPVLRRSWRVPGAASSLATLAALRAQLLARGYGVVFECEGDGCGGFDFRQAIEVIPAPEMHVNLADFRFLSARRAGADGEGDATGDSWATVLVSQSRDVGYVQIVLAGPGALPDAEEAELSTKAPGAAAVTAAAAPLAETLEAKGRAVLEGLAFDSGSARLAAGPYPALAALAEYLRARPDRRVILVGHTDAAGPLAANIALSRERARAVVAALVREHGVAPAQVAAEGVGFLMPLRSNLTEAGRAANRRVEVVLTSTQ